MDTIETELDYKTGEEVMLVKDSEGGVVITDHNRLRGLLALAGVFIVLVFSTSGTKGVGAIIGMLGSVLIVANVVIPQILSGTNPVLVAILASTVMATVSLYLAHGLSTKTSLAVVSTLLTLAVSIIFALVAVEMTKLSGSGTEEAMFLRVGDTATINLKGLLLAGMIIGALGVLDDVTTAQTTVVYELKSANPKLKFSQLYNQGKAVGREHIASLVNTLVLAYTGAGLPLFLLFSTNNTSPAWFVVNSEFVAEEIVRTIVGSVALILAVPISTYIAAKYYSRNG